MPTLTPPNPDSNSPKDRDPQKGFTVVEIAKMMGYTVPPEEEQALEDYVYERCGHLAIGKKYIPD